MKTLPISQICINFKSGIPTATDINVMAGLAAVFRTVYIFFREGFSNMTVGRTLWGVVLIKLFIMFAILRVFFFPNYLNSRFDTEEEKAHHVINELVTREK